MTRPLAALLCFASGCAGSTTAIVDGKPVPRLELAFSGDPYSITHRRAHPRPGGPSGGLSDDGGTIGGDVCGMQIDYGVEHKRDHVQLVGFIDGDRPSELAIRDEHGTRHITGSLDKLGVDLTLTGDHLEGHAGLRVVSMSLQDDALVGFMRLPNAWNYKSGGNLAVRATLEGRGALWALPAADQAALIPLVLSCHLSSSDPRAAITDFHAGFGGPAKSAPHGSSAIYRKGR
jgi:hypothetical protein